MHTKEHSSSLAPIDSSELSVDSNNPECFTETVNIKPFGFKNLSDGNDLNTLYVKYGIRSIEGPLWRIRTVPLGSREAELVLGAIRGHEHYLYNVTTRKSPQGHYDLVDITAIEPPFCYEDMLQEYQDELSRLYPYQRTPFIEGELNHHSSLSCSALTTHCGENSDRFKLTSGIIEQDPNTKAWFQKLTDPKVEIGKIVFVTPDSTEAPNPAEKSNIEYKILIAGENHWSHFCTAGFTDTAKLLLEAVTGDTSAIYRIIAAKNRLGLYHIVDIQPIDACDFSLSDAEMLKLLFPEDKSAP